MLTQKRQEEILKIVNEQKSVTAAELVKKFHTSESTIRRDIVALHKEGLLNKVFGGAVALDSVLNNREPSVAQKEEVNVKEKRRIAKYAAGLIEAEDIVYLDAGTSTGYMLDYLEERRARFVTNGVEHAKRLAKGGFHVVLIGGELKGSTEAVVGSEAIFNIQKYHFTKGFFGANGVSIANGLTTPDIREALTKQAAYANTMQKHRYVLCDHTKFGLCSAVTFASAESARIITDAPQEALEQKGLTILTAYA